MPDLAELQQGRFEFEPIDVSSLPSGPIPCLLLAPWHEYVHALTQPQPSADNNLIDVFHEVFEQCSSAWTRTGGNGSTIERALQAQDQVQGWYGFRVSWPRFVEEVLEGHGESSAVQPLVGVQFQIDRLPELLDAIRILRGPRFQYTMDVEPSSLVAVMTSHWKQRHPAGDERCLELARSSVERSLGVSL